jgi:branched-chain amino acid transport system substrate-binding protein
VLVAQAYSYAAESEINAAFVAAYTAKQGKNPPQFSAQAFAGIQVFVEALTRLDSRSKLDTLDLQTLRAELQKEILAGTYNTPLGTISFTQVNKEDGSPAGGEINQETFYVAQIKMNPDGETGVFEFLPGTFGADTGEVPTSEPTAAPTQSN